MATARRKLVSNYNRHTLHDSLDEIRYELATQAFTVRRTASYHAAEPWNRTDKEMGFTPLAPIPLEEKTMPLIERIRKGLLPNAYVFIK